LLKAPRQPTFIPYTTLFRSCRSLGEGRARQPRVATDDHSRSSAVLGPMLGERPGSAHDDRAVHACGPGANGSPEAGRAEVELRRDRKSTRLNSSHVKISYAV